MDDLKIDDTPDTASGSSGAAEARPSLSEQIYRDLRLSLISGAYAPGERLNISRLAEAFGTSVTPVREAIFQLVREHALEFRSGYQPRVPVLGIDEYIGIRETRVPLERLAARLAAARLEEADLVRLEALHEAFVAEEAAENWREALAANRNFHFMIYNNCGNPVLSNVIENLWLSAGPTAARQYPLFRNAITQPHLHNIFIAAVRDGRHDEAAEAIVDDLRDGSFRIIRHLQAVAADQAG